MVLSQNVVPGMVVLVTDKLYRVESSVKVTVPKGQPFIKMKLRSLSNEKIIEKNFKIGQDIKDVSLEERRLEFLYLEGRDYLFLDIGNLEKVLVSAEVIGDKLQFLKEGTELQATFYGESLFSVDLPQFLELMVAKSDQSQEGSMANTAKLVILETGAEIEVPRFIEVGDVIKVDTRTREYVQRI